MGNIEKSNDIFGKISGLIESARKRVAVAINQEMVILYWNIGKAIKAEIMKSSRAKYGKQIVQSLTAQLVLRYGRGFSAPNLWHMVKFYEIYPILSAVQRELEGLSWTHIKSIIYIKDKLRIFNKISGERIIRRKITQGYSSCLLKT